MGDKACRRCGLPVAHPDSDLCFVCRNRVCAGCGQRGCPEIQAQGIYPCAPEPA